MKESDYIEYVAHMLDESDRLPDDFPANPQSNEDFDKIEKHFRDNIDSLINIALSNYTKKHRRVSDYADYLFDFILDKVEREGLIEEIVGEDIYTDEAFIRYIENQMDDYCVSYMEKNPMQFDSDGNFDKEAEMRRLHDDTQGDYVDESKTEDD